jgi:thiamine biosynthesis lipoprotein ApbE
MKSFRAKRWAKERAAFSISLGGCGNGWTAKAVIWTIHQRTSLLIRVGGTDTGHRGKHRGGCPPVSRKIAVFDAKYVKQYIGAMAGGWNVVSQH